MEDIWTRYLVRWEFITNLCGSVPGDPELVKPWLDARKPTVKPAGAKSIDEIQEEVAGTILEGEPEVKYSYLVFQKWDGALVVRASTIKSHLKDCAKVLSNQYIGRIKGERAFSTRVINGVYVDNAKYWIPILRPDGAKIVDADSERDKAIHVKGPMGQPMNALKRFQQIYPARLDFTLLVLGKSASQQDLETLFLYGGQHGYAGERGDGEGRYTFQIELQIGKEKMNGKSTKAQPQVEDDRRSEHSQRVDA